MIKGEILGDGTYGIVYSCSNINTGEKYAIKRNLREKTTLFLSSVRELDLLNKLKDHPHIIKLEFVSYKNPFVGNEFESLDCKERKNQSDDEIHFIFEKASYNLYQYVDKFKLYPDYGLLKRYMIQILLSIEYMHKHSIIHCDLKPQNILVMEDAIDVLGDKNIIKICDMGLSIPYTYQGCQTPNVVTSWYRAPEIILGYPHYDYKSDIWSIGCIFFEIIAGIQFLAKTQENDNALVSKILSALPEELSIKMMRSLITSNKWKKIKLYAYHNPKGKRKSWVDKLNLSKQKVLEFEKNAGSLGLFCDLLDQMFQFDWDVRIDITKCIAHPFFQDKKELIDETRKLYNPEHSFERMLYITPCQERNWVKEVVNNIFNNRHEKPIIKWYNHRILFQSLHLFDSYISGIYEDKELSINTANILTKYDTLLRFYSFLYLCVKYFGVLDYNILFSDVFSSEYFTSQAKLEIEIFERGIVQKMDHDIYRVSIYEAADNFIIPMNDNHILKLLKLYLDINQKLIIKPSNFVKLALDLK